MKHNCFPWCVIAVLALAGCGSDDPGYDADADAVPDPVFEDVPDILPDAPDMPGDEIPDPPPDEATDGAEDAPSDGSDCPSPPTCDPPLIGGIENAIDESGCPTGYCCTGVEVALEGLWVMSTVTLSLTGSGTVTNIGDVAVVYSDLDCEIRNPVDDSLVASCEAMTLVSDPSLDPDQSLEFDIAPVCVIHGPEPCFDPVDVVCTFTWETIGCYSSGSAEVTETVEFVCGV